MQAIQTLYRGYKFRSRLEARWAVFFDALNIKYLYEPEGFQFDDGTMYLPDFYLPDSDSFFEVKGIMSQIDRGKINKLVYALNRPVTIGYDDLEFETCMNNFGKFLPPKNTWTGWLCKCKKCKKIFFMNNEGAWSCHCCGFYDGNNGFDVLLYSDGRPPLFTYDAKVERAIEAFKQARFEHGESPDI